MSRSARLFASISRVIRRDWRIWRSRCWRVGYRYATSKMHSGRRTVGCCYPKAAVSQLGERLWEDYQAFAQRDLSEYEITYLFVDGIAERLRPGGKREPVLAAWGFTIEGGGASRAAAHDGGLQGRCRDGDRVLRRHEKARPE